MTTTERLRRAMQECEARERRRAATREEFDADLSAEDLASGAMYEAWDESQPAPKRGRSGLRWVVLASVLFWAGVLLVTLA